ncbi:unnamed protein product [Larinioides sclopetarius]|uniref:Uncharacterized protein n=1 Tax=Larinioides sclopetarius TaxID=280406 RepID=A0AAV1ZVU7_9ARAC
MEINRNRLTYEDRRSPPHLVINFCRCFFDYSEALVLKSREGLLITVFLKENWKDCCLPLKLISVKTKFSVLKCVQID